MKFSLFVLPAYLLIGVPTCKEGDVKSDSAPITHELWDAQLGAYVNDAGFVDYEGWRKDTARLEAYLDLVRAHHPNKEHWTPDERLAYWINAYNAFTVELILDHWPVTGIKDIKDGTSFINSVWDIKFIEIEGHSYDLNNIEHGFIRPKFEDQRIHMAVNCASVSCPQLRNEAFVAERLSAQLDDQSERFFASFRNEVSADPPKVSSIFKWYAPDFEWGGSTLRAFVEKYSGTSIDPGAELQYLDYDWSINAQANDPS